MSAEVFGDWLKNQLDRRQLSQAEFARRASVSGTAVSHWITGRKLPDAESCDKIAEALFLGRDEGGIRHNPLEGIKGPGAPPLRDTVWSPEQVRRFLDQTDGDDFGYAWALLFASCCRIGELCALQWSDVDFDAATVAIRRTWGKNERGIQVLQISTKTKSARVIPLPGGIVAMLRRVRLARSFDDGGFVVALRGRRVTPRMVRDAWRAAVASSGLPVLTPHGARHSGATNMITAGVPVSVVARILGHSDPAMTLRRYVHPDTSDDEAAISALDKLYGVPSGEMPEKIRRIR